MIFPGLCRSVAEHLSKVLNTQYAQEYRHNKTDLYNNRLDCAVYEFKIVCAMPQCVQN